MLLGIRVQTNNVFERIVISYCDTLSLVAAHSYSFRHTPRELQKSLGSTETECLEIKRID